MRQRVIVDSEKHKLVHVSLYATREGPRPKKRQVFMLHLGCGTKVARGTYKILSDRSKREVTCIGCARVPPNVNIFTFVND